MTKNGSMKMSGGGNKSQGLIHVIYNDLGYKSLFYTCTKSWYIN